jgi:diguanylate cyclase (GGDEF)-like protein
VAGEVTREDTMREASDTRDTGPRVGSPLWVYLTAVTAVGLGVLVLALAGLTRADVRALAGSPLWWMLALLVVCGELRPIITPGKSVADAAAASITFSFAALIYWGMPAAAVVQAGATIIAGTAARQAGFRNAFNAAQYTISLGAAAAVLAATGAHPSPVSPWVPTGGHLGQVALAALAYFACNIVLVGIAVALHARAPVVQTIQRDLPYQVLVNMALLSAAPLVVVVMNRSAALVPLFLLPIIAVYTNAAMSVNRAHQALHDELTGLPNRKFLILRTTEALAESARQDLRVGLLLLDLDRFKEVNDTLGHVVGDRLLRVVAHRLVQSVRPGDVVARLGGDEFAVLLPMVRDAAAREVAARLRAALAEPIRMDAMDFDIEASVGLALHPDHAPDFELLLQRADVAMYVAKERRTGVEAYDVSQDRNSPARLSLLGELRRAMEAGQLELYFQPKTLLADGQPVGVEALLRWRHPSRGVIKPEEFIPVAEQSYLMRDLTRYVMDAALTQVASWWRAGLRVQVAVNVSGSDLLNPAFAEVVASGLRRHSLPPAALLLEITERVLMSEPAYAAGCVETLARMGIPLSLDDFGTGYSSLVRLKRLPVCEIKIDSSFVRRMLNDPDDKVIVQSLVDLVRTLGIRSVAEGVETGEVAEALREMGCDAAQGWYVGGPLDAAAAAEWLAERLGSIGRDGAARNVTAGVVGGADAAMRATAAAVRGGSAGHLGQRSGPA